MLQRSPRSRIATYVFAVICLLAGIISGHAIWKLHSLSQSYGPRVTVYMAAHNLATGDQLTEANVSPHTMFERDAPPGALQTSPLGKYAYAPLLQGSIMTQSFVVDEVSELTATGHDIVFIPTDIQLNSSAGTYVDLWSPRPEGYGSELLSENCEILFDLSDNSQDSVRGYFVLINKDDISDVVAAISVSEVQFALHEKSH